MLGAETAIFADGQFIRMQFFVPSVNVVAPFALAAA
jgi:hypothetical protein